MASSKKSKIEDQPPKVVKVEQPTFPYTVKGKGQHTYALGEIINKEERELSEELFNTHKPKAIIDNFEQTVGLKPKTKKKKNVAYKNRQFNLEVDKDRDLLNTLMNSPKYRIVYFKDTWTALGLYRMFVIYEENLDYTESESNE